MERILKNIEGLNLVFDRAPKEILIDIAREIFSVRNFEQILISNNCYSSLSWNHNLERLFDEDGTVSDKERFNLIMTIKCPIMRMHQTLYLLDKICTEGKIDFSYRVIQSLKGIDCKSRVNDARSLGYRKLLGWYADQGDIENFLKTIKVCESGKERDTIAGLKATFIKRYAENNGGEEAIKIARKKPFGPKFLSVVLLAIATKTSYKEMKILLEAIDSREDIPHEDVIRVLAISFRNHSEDGINEEEYSELFDSINNLNPKIKAGDFRLRDTLLLNVGLNLVELEKVVQCRKAINNNNLKKELRFLEKELSNQ